MGRPWSAPEPRQKRSLENPSVETGTGKIGDVSGFAQHRYGLNALFDWAAYFRAGFKVRCVKLKLSEDGKKMLVHGYLDFRCSGVGKLTAPWMSGKKASRDKNGALDWPVDVAKERKDT
jgi:hypothetical protein